MASVGTGRRIRPKAGIALGLAVSIAGVGFLGWVGWVAARVALLRGEVEAAYSAADWPRAASALTRLRWYRPDDLEALRMQVEVALERGDRLAAAEALGAVPRSSSEAAAARHQRGLLLKELFRVREAEAAFREAVSLRPDFVEPRRELIALLGIERRGPEQVAELWGLRDRARRPVEALRLLAQSIVVIPPGALSRTADEGEVLRACLEADPTDPNIRPPLARFHRKRGETEQARGFLDPWLESHPNDGRARVEWLACLLDEGDVEAAAPWFRRADPGLEGLADFHRLRAEWLALQSRHDDALAALKRAEELDPRDPELSYLRARCERALGKPKEAEAALTRHARLLELARLAAAVSEEGREAAPLLKVARACLVLGRSREATAWFEQALRLDPSNQDARNGLEAVSVATGVVE